MKTIEVDFSTLPPSKEERESAINWMATDDTVSIFSEDRKVLRDLTNKGFKPYSDNGYGGYFFKLPLKCLSFRKDNSDKPKRKRTMSPEQRKAASERMKRLHSEGKMGRN